MTHDFEMDVKAGRIFRKKKCERCGAVDYEQYLGDQGLDWEQTPQYRGLGFGAVVIVPYVEGVERMEFTLCPGCASVLRRKLDQFFEARREDQ